MSILLCKYIYNLFGVYYYFVLQSIHIYFVGSFNLFGAYKFLFL
jgi:hypothetical protein